MEYRMKQLNQCCRVILPVLLLMLGGCVTVQDVMESDPSGLLSSLAEKTAATPAEVINKRMLHADQASDRIGARNSLIGELISDADQVCHHRLALLPQQIEKWTLAIHRRDKLAILLNDGISQRPLDHINPDLAIALPEPGPDPKQQLADAMVAIITAQREAIRTTLTAREELDIHRYPIKQALLDVRTYHLACSAELGLSGVTHASSSQRMTVEEKQMKVESLIQLRQILMEQGLSTRTIQKQIDAVILAD